MSISMSRPWDSATTEDDEEWLQDVPAAESEPPEGQIVTDLLEEAAEQGYQKGYQDGVNDDADESDERTTLLT